MSERSAYFRVQLHDELLVQLDLHQVLALGKALHASPSDASRSTSIQFGAGACARGVAGRQDGRIVLAGFANRKSRRPLLTMAEGILHLRPLTSMWPWRTTWRACARLVPKPIR